MHDDPFERLGLPATYDLDRDQIERAFLRRLARVHPDAARAHRPSADHADDAQASAMLTEARAALEHPESRANALLARLGGPSASRDASLPDGFLQEILEIRQSVEQAIASGSPGQREHWTQWALDQRERYRKRVGDSFRRAGDPPDAELLRSIRTQLNAWRYIERLIEQLDPQYDPNRADFA